MKKLSEKEKAIHDQFSKYGANAKEWMKKCVLLLPLVEAERVWEKRGFGSIYEYAAKIAGMSRYKVRDSLRIIRKISDKPALLEVAKVRGLNAIRPVVALATKESAEFWAGKAMEMGKNTLETFARDFKKENLNSENFANRNLRNNVEEMQIMGELEFGPRTRSPINNGLNKAKLFCENGEGFEGGVENVAGDNGDEKIQLSMKVDLEVLEALKKMKGKGDWNEAMKKLLELSREKIEAEVEAERKELEDEQNRLELVEIQRKKDEIKFQKELWAEKPAPVRSNTHKAPVAIEKYIKKRSGGNCEHPNCGKAGEHIHHIDPFALTKTHDPDRMLHLCKGHHRIIHLGYIDDGEIRVVGLELDRDWGGVEVWGVDSVRVKDWVEVGLAKEAGGVEVKDGGRVLNSVDVKDWVGIAMAGTEAEADMAFELEELRRKQWKQVEKLPSYDIKNLINGRVAEFGL